MVDVRFELTTNDPWSVDDAICENTSPLGYWQKVNQSPTQTKPYNIHCAHTRQALSVVNFNTKWYRRHILRLIFFISLLSLPFFSVSSLVVTRIRGHIAGYSPPFLPTTIRALHFYRRIASNCAYPCYALSAVHFFSNANKFVTSPR